MNVLLEKFIENEVNENTYSDLWSFINSGSLVRGTFECQGFVVMKISSKQFIIYPLVIGGENTKYQDAVMVAKNYFLKKINSKAYKMKFPDIQNILD